MRHSVTNFSRGLYLSGPLELIPEGYLRRARGIGPLSDTSIKSRDGSASIRTVADSLIVYSAVYFASLWFTSASTYLNIGNVLGAIANGISSNARLSYAAMPPTAGKQDQLFVAGGGSSVTTGQSAYALDLFKVDQGLTSITQAGTYSWTASGSEYYLVDVATSGDPALPQGQPDFVLENGTPMTIGTAGALTAGQWDWSSDTVYVRLTDGADPDSKADGYLTIGYVTNWGIEPPATSPTAADSAAAGNPDGTLKYRLTYFNSVTGTRSNPSPIDTELSLLLHMDGTDEATTFTDSSYYTHTATGYNNVNTETSVKKFGTASAEFDGNTDWIQVANHPSLNPDSEPFTIDCWVRLNDVETSKNHGVFAKYQGASDYFAIYVKTQTAPLDDYAYIHYVEDAAVQFSWLINIGDLTVDTFYHLAVIRGWQGLPNRIGVTLDGTLKGYFDYAGEINNSGDVVIGADNTSGGSCINGYIDELRFIKGSALWTKDFTAPTTAASSGTVTVDTNKVSLSNIPESLDPQVDSVEIWRTMGDGDIYYRCAVVSNGTTTYTDNVSDTYLSSTELPTDNLKPYDWFSDCFGPHNASMFWITRTQAGERGRLYYSPIGRAEAVLGYIEVTHDGDPLQRITEWSGMLLVFSKGGVFQILGDSEPYTARRLSGIPGTSTPYTVVSTPLGVIWQATDGIRIFSGGAQSELLHYDAIKPIFRGLTGGQITSFNGVVATYARNEYIISDASQTIALDLTSGRWRDLGVGCYALHYSPIADQIGASLGTNKFLALETESSVDDNGTDISFEIEVPAPRDSAEVNSICQTVIVDGTTGNESLTATLVYDSSTATLGTVQHNGRTKTELPANKTGRVFSLRLAGSLDAAAQCVEIAEVAFDIYSPTKGK